MGNPGRKYLELAMGKTIRRKDKGTKKYLKNKNRNKDIKRKKAYEETEERREDSDYN